MQVRASNQGPSPLKQQQPPPQQPQPPEEPQSRGPLAVVGDEVTLGLQNFAYAQSALPKFVYPSVFGTPAEKALIWDTLDHLPMRDAVQATSITMKDTLNGTRELLGITRPATGSIGINRTGWGMENPADVQYTLTHEIGHTVDYKGGTLSVLTRSNASNRSDVWGQGPYVSEYAKTQKPEDFAESYAESHIRPDRLNELNPDKAAELKRVDAQHPLEALVDRPEFRETGKFVANAIGVHPWGRSGLEFGREIAVMSLCTEGAASFFEGAWKGNAAAATYGLLSTAAGAGMAFSHLNPSYGVASMAALGARQGLSMAVEHKAGGVATAAATVAGGVGGAVGGVAGPLGLTYAGYHMAGPIGGAVGMVVGGILGNRVGAYLGAKAALAVADA